MCGEISIVRADIRRLKKLRDTEEWNDALATALEQCEHKLARLEGRTSPRPVGQGV